MYNYNVYTWKSIVDGADQHCRKRQAVGVNPTLVCVSFQSVRSLLECNRDWNARNFGWPTNTFNMTEWKVLNGKSVFLLGIWSRI